MSGTVSFSLSIVSRTERASFKDPALTYIITTMLKAITSKAIPEDF
jgi:hypothetical protein